MDQLIPALAALFAGIGAYLAGRARIEAKAAGNVLNGNAPIRAASNPRIYDMVTDLTEKVDEISGEVTRIRTNCPSCQMAENDRPSPPA